MPIHICCTQYKDNGACLHPEAPRSLFKVAPSCIEAFPVDTGDPRLGRITVCKIKIPYPKSQQPPLTL